jgi:hypothetical protein
MMVQICMPTDKLTLLLRSGMLKLEHIRALDVQSQNALRTALIQSLHVPPKARGQREPS